MAGKKKGKWSPEDGYDWVNPDDDGDLRVKWKPGKKHPDHTHVVASKKQGKWSREDGYDWVNPDDDGDWRVVRVTFAGRSPTGSK